ncbi:MAG: DUF488 family protein [Thermomicrobiales bacterium]
MRIYTIGFTRKPAERFFELIRTNGVERLVDIRLHPDGQLAGFAKKGDLPYFLRELAGCDYEHCPILAPTSEIFTDYRKDHRWDRYVERFEALMDDRGIPGALDRQKFEAITSCLLCSEHTPDQCHRRLVAERLAAAWPGTEIVHLV